MSILPVTTATEQILLPPKQDRASILAAALTALEKQRAALGKQEDAFWAATLGNRLQIGLQCLKAHAAFSIKSDIRKGVGGRGKKNSVTRDGVSGEGFEGWLATEVSWLKKPTAYKYMTAVRGLGLDHTATEKQVAAALRLAHRKGPVTLAALCRAAVEGIAPPKTPGAPTQTEFEFLRSGLAQFRQECDALLSLRPQLEENPEMKRAAAARAYTLLSELTGTNWKPSDEPDDLASVNPDSITL